MLPLLTRHFRCFDLPCDFTVDGEVSAEPGFFRFGAGAICYGRTSTGHLSHLPGGQLDDVSNHVTAESSEVRLPFDPEEAVENLREERYASDRAPDGQAEGIVRSIYYLVRPILPLWVRKHLQRAHLRGWEKLTFPNWPVDRTADDLLQRFLMLALRASGMDSIPFIWFWPDGARACAIMTHDVESDAGKRFCSRLMDINDSFGVPASFQIVPEKRYSVEPQLLAEIKNRGFEVNIHDLNHDGRLFQDRAEFERRIQRIHQYAHEFGAAGFRSAVLYRNPAWLGLLQFEYDMSIPNVAHLDPQRGGCCTVMPYFIDGLLELPLTATQDHSLFHILNDFTMDLWDRQTKFILQQNGLMSFIVHPDYVIAKRNQDAYRNLLGLLRELRAKSGVWMALPKEVNRWWRQRDQMILKRNGESWTVEGEGSERARVAMASVQNDRLVYSLADQPTTTAEIARGT